jgi:Na+/proline symporter
MWLNFPGLVLIVTLTVLIGVVMFAFYSQCHPVSYGIVNKNDQLLPLFVLDTLGTVPGLSGVFIACVFSGGLSTISSGLNAMSAVLLEDFIKPFCCGSVVKKHGIFISKALVVVIGVIQFGVAVLISRFSGLILQFSYSMYSITAGPIFGLFVAGMIFPWTNKYGAPIGFLASIAIMCWLGLGALIEKPSGYKPLPTYTSACNWTAMGKSPPVTTLAPIVTGSTTTTEEPILYDFYRMSYQWYTGLGMIICVGVSLLVSFLTGYTKPSAIDSRLMCPIFDIMFPFLPEKVLKPMRFGVVYDKNEKYITNDDSTESDVEKMKNGVDNQSFSVEKQHNLNSTKL